MTGAEWERLLLEAVPDGSFGGRRPVRRRGEPLPDPNAAAHCRELLAALAERSRPVARGDPAALTGGAGPVGR